MKYPSCFDGIGLFAVEEKLMVKEDAIPSIDPPRKFPLALKERLKTELEHMERQGVIRRAITDETNAHAARKIREKADPHWSPVCIEEMKAFRLHQHQTLHEHPEPPTQRHVLVAGFRL
ncbi:hypothetical protein CAPTEDRAFT_190078 [Capitella teleta]|uniref:Uncharacterized protein n=1 Tax=Capitella teleta TaxID=283909 RepID=R7TV26_CAPTE|nr:hypothetical protein CAPTEDRAFT_190078 [Capitella teleta]|eukprot:ELT95296.1 hypothetical protein CAPTEDRAFT_190078 [Capitella teleta]